jgi:hypothetical protein
MSVAVRVTIRERTALRLARDRSTAKVPAMSDEYQDPSGDTQAFRAFADRSEPAAPARSFPPLIIGGVALVAIVLVLVLVLVLLVG